MARSIQLLMILTSLIVCGCSVIGAQQNLDESEAAYARCETTSDAGGADCESLKKEVESNQQIYDQTSSQVRISPSRRFMPLTGMDSNPNPDVNSTPDN